MQNESELVLVRQLGALRLLTLNRPAKLNTFTAALLAELDGAVAAAAADDGTRVIAITGSGERAFSTGNDIMELSALDAVGAYRSMTAGQRVLLKLHDLGKPVIALVNGFALGGGFELALACDFVIASDTARFGFPEITLNTMPGWGGTQFAVAKLGPVRAKHMVLTGRQFTAQECEAFGFLHQVVAQHELLDTARALAASLAGHDGLALEMAKRAVNRAGELPLAAGCDFEAAHYAVNFSGERARAGIQAFARRRSAGGRE
jgi:enoyl-CoA hydratase/3-hydroxypropionyl-coenzyme A dehydratase